MELSKIRPGQNYNYVTIHGNEGRGKVIGFFDGQRGSFVQIVDKETGKQIKVRPSQLSR